MKTNHSRETIDQLKAGAWSISIASGMLSDGNGNSLYLEPRLAKLFCALVANGNQLVSRKQLIAQLWEDTIVNEESLTRAISDLRKVLKTAFDHPPQIQTLPKRGYKMIITMPVSPKAAWKTVLLYIVYGLLGFVLLILIIRGLNY